MPLLARTGHLKPLGKPAQNACKWYATISVPLVPALLKNKLASTAVLRTISL